MGLARFRADPKQVRVSIRHVDEGWRVSVTCIATGQQVCLTHSNARVAVRLAIKRADKEQMPGIDDGLQWAYDHPQSPTIRMTLDEKRQKLDFIDSNLNRGLSSIAYAKDTRVPEAKFEVALANLRQRLTVALRELDEIIT
jgi:hypothetical protein